MDDSSLDAWTVDPDGVLSVVLMIVERFGDMWSEECEELVNLKGVKEVWTELVTLFFMLE